jgi:septal ring factor EnvC (AmiA/AmiB activator)
MFSGLAGAALLKILEALFNSFGVSFNAWATAKRAEQARQDLGRVTAERDASEASRQATQRELEAAQNAPQSADDAISRLEEGSA